MLRAVASDIISSTWANKPSSAAATGLYLFTDVGSSGTLMRYANSRWRPIAGQAMLASLGAAVTGITNSETIVLQSLIPAGAWQTNDKIRIRFAITKSGTTDTGTANVRVGTAGTTADAAVVSSFLVFSAANVSGGYELEIKLVSDTTAQRLGIASNLTSAYGGAGGTPAPAAVTISDASANALYVSLSLVSGGATNTLTIQDGTIEMRTP